MVPSSSTNEVLLFDTALLLKLTGQWQFKSVIGECVVPVDQFHSVIVVFLVELQHDSRGVWWNDIVKYTK